MSNTEHALLSASGASRWLRCTPSARLEETLPEKRSDYADEGRLAHEIAELKLRKIFTEPMGPKAFNSKLKKLQADPLYQDEMLKHTYTYVDYISQTVHSFKNTPCIAIEKRLDYSAFVPEGFGTGDTIIIGGNVLYVIDLKYGKGVPVSAENNSQMKLYALGAIMQYSMIYRIERVIMVIVQPRLETISEWETAAEDLKAWGESIKPIAEEAFNGKGEFVTGDHCQFCRAKALCRARSEFNTSLEEYKMLKPPLISDTEVGEILKRAQDLVKWANALEEYALAAILQDKTIPGWKVVEGRAVRQFTDHEAAFEILKQNGTEEAMLYERKPLTLAGVEKLIGKAKFNETLSGLVFTPPGKPTLVLESDKRDPIKRESAQNDFAQTDATTN